MSALHEGWVDLSVPISPRLPVWPGDPPLRNGRTASLADGDPANVTELRMSAHTGTHVDAPVHFLEGGRCVHELDLRHLLGPARVLHLDDAPEVRARALAEARVACVGVDSLSVGGFHADGAAVHRALLEAGVTVIEGLALGALSPGPVELLCLPLRLVDADGSPVRALARPLGAAGGAR